MGPISDLLNWKPKVGPAVRGLTSPPSESDIIPRLGDHWFKLVAFDWLHIGVTWEALRIISAYVLPQRF